MKKKRIVSLCLLAVLAFTPLFTAGCSCAWFGGTYEIEYVMNDDETSPATYAEGEENPDTYTSGLFVLYFNSPSRAGYIFRGWFTTADFSGTRQMYVAPGTTGKLTLYAKWERKSSGGIGGEGGEGGDTPVDPDNPDNPDDPNPPTAALWSDDIDCWRGFMPYIEEFDDARARSSSATVSIDSRDELIAWLEYVQFHYLTSDIAPAVRLNYSYSGYAPSREIEAVYSSLYFGSYVGISYNSSTTPRVGINYRSLVGNEGKLTADTGNYYTQISTYEYAENGSEHDLALDHVTSVLHCSTTNQLFYAAMIGARPLPEEGSDAERIYAKAREVLARIVDETMTDAEKAEAIFKWLVMNVTYDNAALAYESVADAAKYDAFYLEGVFDNGRAVCDGISKAMTLLCRLEGIPCVRAAGGNHAWNKVYVEEKWYIVDATFGDTTMALDGVNYSFMNRKYFLADESANERYGNALNYKETKYAATENYDYYGKRTFRSGLRDYTFRIGSASDFSRLYQWASAFGRTFGNAPYSVDFYTESKSYITQGRYAGDGNYYSIFFNL